MSIIERALGKLGGTPPPAETQPVVETPAATAAAPTPAPREERAARQAAPAGRSVNIDLARMERLGMLTPNPSRGQLAEEFRHIKRPLLGNAFDSNAVPEQHRNLIMVTSAFPGEGKSFCAINLAMSLATEMDRTVLLVDADVARPRILEYLGVRAEHGLLDVLVDSRMDLSDVMLRTNIEKLSIVPAGTASGHSTELLASEAMNALIEEMAGRYPDRVIIFDSPPLLATSQAAVLARHMGQVIMVVEAEKTPRAAVKEAIGLIEDSCDIIGMVLNKTNVRQGAAGYYGYGYGYGEKK